MTTQRRTYRLDGADFSLEPVNDSVIKVTHRDQTGWIGINTEWDAQRPYTWATSSSRVTDDGIRSIPINIDTPDSALRFLCRALLSEQSKKDSQKINPEERKAAARRVLQEFLQVLPPAHPP